MAEFSIEVPDQDVRMVAEAFAQQFNFVYPGGFDEMPPEQQLHELLVFTRQKVIEFLLGVVRNYKKWEALQSLPEIPEIPVEIV